MPAELKPILARQMEVFAGFLEHADHHVGRLIDALGEMEVLDDTLVYYIVGENEFLASKIDDFGGPEAFNHFAVGWAHATDTPYQWTKQVASHWGGTATARSCTGRAASAHAARCAGSSTMSSTSPRRCWRSPASRSRRS